MDHEPRRTGRESFLTIFLTLLFGVAFLTVLSALTLGVFFYVILGAFIILVIGFFHYVLWGYSMSVDSQGEREEEEHGLRSD